MTPFLADLARVLAGLAASTLAGRAVGRSLVAGLTRRERFAWSFAIGLLVQAVCLAALFAVGVRPRASSLLVAEGVVGALALVVGRPSKAQVPARPRSGTRWPLALLAGVAGASWLLFLAVSLADGMWATDFLAFWGYKGKIVFLASGMPRRLFEDPALEFAHREYPLLVPLSLSALASWIGRWNDRALALLYPACSLATLLGISGLLARRWSRLAGALGPALAALCFFLYRPASVGTAEIPLALGFVLAASAAIDFLQRGSSSVARLAAASLFCAAVKPEGTLFIVLLAVVLGARREEADRRSRIAAVAALILPALAHALALRALTGRAISRDFDLRLVEPAHWGELVGRIGTAVLRIFDLSLRDAWLPLLAVAVFFAVTRRGLGDPLIPVFLAALCSYAVVCGLSAFGPVYAVDAAFARIAMTLFPAFTLVIAPRVPSAPESIGREPDRPPAPSLASEA